MVLFQRAQLLLLSSSSGCYYWCSIGTVSFLEMLLNPEKSWLAKPDYCLACFCLISEGVSLGEELTEQVYCVEWLLGAVSPCCFRFLIFLTAFPKHKNCIAWLMFVLCGAEKLVTSNALKTNRNPVFSFFGEKKGGGGRGGGENPTLTVIRSSKYCNVPLAIGLWQVCCLVQWRLGAGCCLLAYS